MKHTNSSMKDWDLIVEVISETIGRDYFPALAGRLRAGRDLDVILVLDEKNGSLTAVLECLATLRAVCQKHKVLFFRTFTSLPLLLSYSKEPDPACIHLMLYPDVEAILTWEKHFVLKTILDCLSVWTEIPGVLESIQTRLKPEATSERVAWYRSLLYEGLHAAQMQQPCETVAIADLASRVHYTARFALYELLTAQGGDSAQLLDIEVLLGSAREKGYMELVEAFEVSLRSTRPFHNLYIMADRIDKALLRLNALPSESDCNHG